MAKREVPEINAGSMADIAFLLLIFFLVTTTMDKDRAYMRLIPRKVENPPPPPPIEKRDICAIRANNANQLMVRGELMSNPDEISDKILEFYRTNEIQNDVTNNFPMYSRTGMSLIDENIARVEAEIEKLENTPDQSPEILDFQYNTLDEWMKKKQALKLYGKNILPEISKDAHIRVDVQIRTQYDLFAKIHTEIVEAEYELKNDAAMKMWGISYGALKKIVDTEPGLHMEEEGKLKLLDILYRFKVVEVTPK